VLAALATKTNPQIAIASESRMILVFIVVELLPKHFNIRVTRVGGRRCQKVANL